MSGGIPIAAVMASRPVGYVRGVTTWQGLLRLDRGRGWLLDAALALGSLAPEVRKAWRDGRIGQAQAEGFTICDDHDIQREALAAGLKDKQRWNEWEVARILRAGARLLLLDEITEGLAPVIVQALGRVVRDLRERGYTIVLVEQNFRFAAPLADRHFLVEHGRIVDMITRDALPSRTEQLHRFLGV